MKFNRKSMRLLIFTMNEENYLDGWVKWAFSKYGNGKQSISRYEMKLAVICLTGKKPVLPKNQNSFTIQDLHDIVGRLKKEVIFGDMNVIYDTIDKDGKGYVTLQDLKEAATANNATVSLSAIDNAFKAADTDNDGRITYHDFISYVKSGMTELGII